MTPEDLRYPIGPWKREENVTPALRARWIEDIAGCPANLRKAVSALGEAQIDTPYRPEGWTVRQVCHHVPDSHLNAYVRFKLALTEDNPTIKPYEEALWAELPDSKLPIEVSLNLLESLHERWVTLLRSLKPADFQRTLVHPAHDRPLSLDNMLDLYSWHGRHHVAHVTSLRERMGW